MKKYEDFVKKYKPVKNHLDPHAGFDGCLFETFGEEIEFVRRSNYRKTWTLLGNDDLHVVPGYHWVNRMGHFITEVPYDEDEHEEFAV